MTNHYGATTQLSQRDKRRQNRKHHRKTMKAHSRSQQPLVLCTSCQEAADNGWPRFGCSKCSTSNAAAAFYLRRKMQIGVDGKPLTLASLMLMAQCRSAASTPLLTPIIESPPSPSPSCISRRTAAGGVASEPLTLDHCPNEVFLEVAAFVTAQELHTLMSVGRRWRWTVEAHDEYLWKPHCRHLWAGRYLSNADIVPFGTVLSLEHQEAVTGPREGSPASPSSISSPSSPAVASPTTGTGNRHHRHHLHNDGFPQGNYHHKTRPTIGLQCPNGVETAGQLAEALPFSWREALCRSVHYAKTDALNKAELVSGAWEIRFAMDESIPKQKMEFFSTPTPHVRTEGFPQMPWALYGEGKVLHVHVFPEQRVSRDPTTWQWKMHNRFVDIEQSDVAQVPSTTSAKTAAFPSASEFLPLPFRTRAEGDALLGAAPCSRSSQVAAPAPAPLPNATAASTASETTFRLDATRQSCGCRSSTSLRTTARSFDTFATGSTATGLDLFGLSADDAQSDEFSSDATERTNDEVDAYAYDGDALDEPTGESEERSRTRFTDAVPPRGSSRHWISPEEPKSCTRRGDRNNVARPRPVPVVSGHGGARDGEDPPSQRLVVKGKSTSPRRQLAAESKSSRAACLMAGWGRRRAMGTSSSTMSGCRDRSQQGVSAGLPTRVRDFLDSLLNSEFTEREQFMKLLDTNVECNIRLADGASPRRVHTHRSAHLLDCRPSRPP